MSKTKIALVQMKMSSDLRKNIQNATNKIKIAAKKDAKDTNNKKGKVILVNLIAKSIFWSSSIKPGANNDTKKGANNSTIITKRNSAINKILKTWFANLSDLVFPNLCSEVKLGINAALNVPSENNLLNVFGILNATKKASAIKPVPKKKAIRISLIYPDILLNTVKKLNVPVDLIKFINHISLNLVLFVHINIINEKNKSWSLHW